MRAPSEKSHDPKVWKYDAGNGWVILAGKTSFDNELLSLEFASPDDCWFHSADCPGSHVVLRGPEGERASEELVKMAASVAAWHSKGRGNPKQAVDFTLAKYVSKPPHSPEGTVEITHSTRLKVPPKLPSGEKL